MSPDEANTIRNRIAMYDTLMAESHALQKTVDTLLCHRDEGMQIHFCGNSAWTSISSEIADDVREAIIGIVRVRQEKLAHERGELTSPPGTVNHE